MLTDSEYQEIKAREGTLKALQTNQERDAAEHITAARTMKAAAELTGERLKLYINYLADAVKEYEDAHPDGLVPDEE